MLTLSISSKPSSRFTAVYQVYTMSIIGKADHDMLQLFAKFLSTPLVDREKIEKSQKWCIRPHQLLWLPFGLLSTLSSFVWPHDDYCCPEMIDFLELDTSWATRRTEPVSRLYTIHSVHLNSKYDGIAHKNVGICAREAGQNFGPTVMLLTRMNARRVVCRNEGYLCIPPVCPCTSL